MKRELKGSAVSCIACGASDWLPLPEPAERRSLTTSGSVLRAALAKFHCSQCGLVRRLGVDLLGESAYYEEQYADYYARPGARHYDQARYAVMAAWTADALDSRTPRRILDAGCGAGWSMLATRERFPESEITGIEPSVQNAAAATALGFKVLVQRIGYGTPLDAPYDLIYTNNVLMHTVDPVAFLKELGDGLADDGRLVIICPDASEPSSELLWVDHNLSFAPDHVRRIARRAGLTMIASHRRHGSITILDKQLCVLAKADSGVHDVALHEFSEQDVEALYTGRCEYLAQWPQLAKQLAAASGGSRRTFNFGSSMWTWLLAAYCKDYWDGVNACLVDNFSGRCIDKEVIDFRDAQLTADDCLVLGVNPRSQDALAARLSASPARIIKWNDGVLA